jgi:hypothetical protein
MSSPQEHELAELMGKKMWVLYRLQSLTTPRFIRTANRILSGEDLLLRKRNMSEASIGHSSSE